jgi:hypothetical protein
LSTNNSGYTGKEYGVFGGPLNVIQIYVMPLHNACLELALNMPKTLGRASNLREMKFKKYACLLQAGAQKEQLKTAF